MKTRKVSNPLALAILAQLQEREMHPYEVAAQMRYRGVEQSIKLNYGSLYSVIEVLQREGLIVPVEMQRDGRRPERTVYGLTAAGRLELFSWLRELLSTPVKEYTQFAAGLSFLGHLTPGETITLLEERIRRIQEELAASRLNYEATIAHGIDRLFLLELEHGLVVVEAELQWVRQVIGLIRDGTLAAERDGVLVWKALLHRHADPQQLDRTDADDEVEKENLH